MSKQADLLAYLFEGEQSNAAARHLSIELLRWLEASPRFTTFVDAYRDKIRKKIRVTREPESLLDVRAELELARCLLADRRLDVAYETYASAKTRGPDFSVTYRANLVFNIEVARVRAEINEETRLPKETGFPQETRLLRLLLDKLGQMQPGMPNLLAIHTQVNLARSIDLDQWMRSLKTRVEGRDPSFYSLSRYPTPAAFYKDFLHLSGILLWSSEPEALAKAWHNKQSRPGLDEKVLRVVAAALQGTTNS